MAQDEKIRAAIHGHLEWSPDIDASHIQVLVDSGKVLLQGTVGSYWSRLVAENLAALFYSSLQQLVTSSEKEALGSIVGEEPSHIRRPLALRRQIQTERAKGGRTNK
jgi:hypothetical protein